MVKTKLRLNCSLVVNYSMIYFKIMNLLFGEVSVKLKFSSASY